LILAGQANLVDKLMYRTSMPLASRIVARSHLEGVNRQDMEVYLKHHLAIAGVKTALFDDTAITAIHQGAPVVCSEKPTIWPGELSSPPLMTSP
jgi:type II secretory pathway predicted ATPase ExeA